MLPGKTHQPKTIGIVSNPHYRTHTDTLSALLEVTSNQKATHIHVFFPPQFHTKEWKNDLALHIYMQVLPKHYDTYFFGLQKGLVRLPKMSADQKTLVFTQDLTMPLYWVYFHQKLSSKIKFAVKMNSKTTLTTAF